MSFSLYLHYPFCRFRCGYCDFNTYAGLDALAEPYTHALIREIEGVGQAGGRPPAHTVFLGGGTPSLMPLDLLHKVLAALQASFQLTAGCEITLEANPGTVSRAYLAGLRDLGVNRLSLGVQSSHPHELRLLDRHHLFGDVAQAVTWARAAGIENINLDLIYGIPHQTLAMWQATVHRVLALGPDHVSAYALSLEHGTPLRAWVQRGLLPLPDSDLAADMYIWADETLRQQGFVQYEISNWARNRALVCRHNLQYWRNQPYLGLGAGAHGYAAARRYSTVLAPAAYIERLKHPQPAEFPCSPAAQEVIRLTPADEMGETMLTGLRLTEEGVPDANFRARFGVGLYEQYRGIFDRLVQRQLLEWDGTRARLTPAGRLLGNIVFREFV